MSGRERVFGGGDSTRFFHCPSLSSLIPLLPSFLPFRPTNHTPLNPTNLFLNMFASTLAALLALPLLTLAAPLEARGGSRFTCSSFHPLLLLTFFWTKTDLTTRSFWIRLRHLRRDWSLRKLERQQQIREFSNQRLARWTVSKSPRKTLC